MRGFWLVVPLVILVPRSPAPTVRPSEPTPNITVLARFQGHRGWVLRLRLAANGRWLCSASADDTVRVWDLLQPGASESLRGHRGSTFDCAFVDTDQVLTAGRDNTIRLWSRQTGGMRILAQHEGDVQTIGLSPQATFLVSGGRDRKLRVMTRTRGGAFAPAYAVPIFGVVVDLVWVAPDRFLTALENGRIILWNLGKGLQAERIFMTRQGGIRCLSYDASRGLIFAGTTRGEIYRWPLEDTQNVQVWRAHRGWVTALAYHPEPPLLITAGRDRMLRWWTPDGQLRAAYPTTFTVLTMVQVPHTQDLLLAGEAPDIFHVRWQLDSTAQGPER